MTESARITLSANEGKLEIVGSEEFVAKNIERFAPVITQMLSAPKASARGSTNGAAGGGAAGGAATNGNGAGAGDGDWQSKYENVFALNENKIQVLVDLPGNSTAEKTVSAALLLALGNTLRGQEDTAYEEIRDVCKAHGAFDSPHFSETIKAEKDAFIIAGAARSPNKTLRLTVPGRRRAEALADSLR